MYDYICNSEMGFLLACTMYRNQFSHVPFAVESDFFQSKDGNARYVIGNSTLSVVDCKNYHA